MENHPVVLGNQDGKTASGAVPTSSVLAKQPQCSGRADQRTLLSNHDSCDLMSSAISSVKSKVKIRLPANCTSGDIIVTLDNNAMWNEFYHRNTEMILTKQGRRMFPYCRYWITGLEPNLKYVLVMDISPVDKFCYKWNGYSWEPSGKAEPHVLGQVFIHPESPSTGRYWMLQPVSFYKLKLTNNTLDLEEHIILHSMHRYLPRLHLVPADKATEVIQLNGPDVQTFTFPQTEFFAVTAYQNIQITQLKIDYNPFAKGLMKDGLKSRLQYEAKQNTMSLHEGLLNPDRCSGAVILNSEQRDLNASYRNQKMCNTGLKTESFNSDPNEDDEQALKQESFEFLIANPCESNSHVKSLLISNEGINISIEEELVDDYDSAPDVNRKKIRMKQEDTHKESKDVSCNDDDPILEKQLKKHSKMRRKEVEIKSHKRSHNSPLGVAKTKMLKLDNGTIPVNDCEVTKSMVTVSNLQPIFSSYRMDKSSLRQSTRSFPVHFENIIRPLDVVETKIKKLFSGNEKAQKCSLVKDVPWENIQIRSNHSIKKKTSNFKLVPSAAAKFFVGEKKPNIAKKPVLSHDVDSNPSAVLSGPCRRGRPQELKCPEIKQPLKYATSVIRNSCAALGPHSDHLEFMLDLEDVDGVLFVSFESKEGLHSHTIDKSGRTEEPQNVQDPLQITCDSDCQERLSLLETKLLEDLKSFRHKQVIHPSLQEVGMKLGSVDPTISIDLKYLGVQLPLSSSKDHVFSNSQGTSPSSLDSGLSFISKTGKPDNFRKIKEKFHSASGQKGSILEGSLKNQAAFCSDKLDEYLESEVKQMETSVEISTSFSSHPLVYQFSSESSNCVQAQVGILKKTSTITPPTSYSLNSPLPSILRRSRRNINSKQAVSRGSIRSNNYAVPLPVLSKEKHNFQALEDKCINSQLNSKPDNTVNVLMISDENMLEKPRSVRQSKQNSHVSQTKLMDLEDCALQGGKARTYITEERADFSLTTLFISQVDMKLIDLADCASQQGKPRTYVSEERADVSLSALFTAQALLNNRHVCKLIRRQTTLHSSNFCQRGCVCTSLALEKSQPTVSRNTKCTLEYLKGNMALIKGTSIKKPLHGILACCNGQEEEWKLEPIHKWEKRNDDLYKAELEQLSINFPICVKGEETDKKPIYIPTPSAIKSTKCMMLPHSEVVFPFNKLNPIYDEVKLEQVKISNSISLDGDCELPEELCGTENDSWGNSVNANQKEELDNIKPEEGKILHVQEAVSKVIMSDLIPEENELILNQPDNFEDRGTCVIIFDKNTSASETVLKHTGKELTSEAPFIYPDISTDVISSDHSYISRKPNMETAEVMIEKEQHAKYLGGTSDKISEGYKPTTVLESNVLQESSRNQEEIVQFKRSIAQTQRPATASETHKQTLQTSEEMTFVEWPPQQSQIMSMNCTKMQQRGTISTPCQWENKNDFSLSTNHWKEETMEHIKPEGDEEEKKKPGVNFTKCQNTLPRKKCKKTVQEFTAKRNNDFQGDSQSVKDNLVQINKTSCQSVAKCLEKNISKINHHKKGFMHIIDTVIKNTEHNGNSDDFAEAIIDRVFGYKTDILNTELFPGQKGATNPIIQHIASPVRKNTKEKVEFGAVPLGQRKSHIQETETMDFKVTMSDSKPQELLVTQPESHAERIKYDKNAVTSRVAGKNTEMVEQLSRDAFIFQLDAVLADHSYFLKETAKMEEHVKLSEDTSDDISQLDESESSEGNKNTDIEFTEKELLQKTSVSDIETAAACALPSRNLHFVRDYSDKEITPSPKQAELRNSKPKDLARTVARFRSKHTEEERCRRKEIKELFEKLQMTLRLHSLPRVAKRILLEKAFKEIQGLTDHADKLVDQKKLLMHKQGILIRKVSALSGKTKEIVLKKLQYINVEQKAIEAQQQQQKQSVKAVEIARPDVQNSPPSETKEVILSKRQEKSMLLSRTGRCTTEIEDSFLMPRKINVMSLATEEDTDLNLDVNRNPYVSLIIDSQSSEPFLPVVPQETINIQSVEKTEDSRGNKKDTAETTEHERKENVFPQIVNVCTLKESPESFETKLCTEELAQSQVEEKQTNRGGGRQQSKDSTFQELQVKEPRTLGLQMRLQKVASTIPPSDASGLMDMEDNDDTDEALTSLQKEIAFLNQQLNDNASDTSDLPSSLHSCISPGDMESHMESATRDGSPFQFDLLGRSFQNLCLVQESSGSITPLLLQLEDDSVADCERALGQPLSKPGLLKLMLGCEVMDPNTNLSAINIGGSEKYMEPLSKITHLSPPSLKMNTNQRPDKADSVWKPMPKLAPFGLKPAHFPLNSGQQINKVMPLLTPSKAKVSNIGLKTTKSVTSQEQD